MSSHYIISDNNPNDGIGGGGCVCHELKDSDCKGPFAVFPGQEMASNLSPHCVLSLACAQEFTRRAEDASEIVTAGEKGAPAEDDLTL